MRYTNPGVGRTKLDFQDKAETLLVSEIFRSFQGEGINAGRPSVFLRLAVCNLHCWYCDTKYTWLYSDKLFDQVRKEMADLRIEEVRTDFKVYDRNEEAKPFSLRKVADQILKHEDSNLVITGGEPLLQQTALSSLLKNLAEQRKFFVEVETNGTIGPRQEIIPLVDQWNVSPKLNSAGNGAFASEKPPSIGAFKKLNSYFKFVIQSERDLQECQGFIERYLIPKARVILMPEAISPELLQQKNEVLSTYCKEKGYRFSSRLQILFYGNARGK
jgi:7-carboxy-7-deazaguanine synthase